MYQIYIKHFSASVWHKYFTPFYSKEQAQTQVEALKTSDAWDGNEGVYDYKVEKEE